jgi:hypothetical protein
MNNSIPTLVKTKDTADAAIDGLFGGMLAGLLMGLVIILAGILAGESPADLLGRFATGQTATPLAGSFVHLAVSSVYGVIFSLIVKVLPKRWLSVSPGWLVGLAYGALLLALAEGVLLPGLRSPLGELPWWVLAAGHAVYGLVLGVRTYPKKG